MRSADQIKVISLQELSHNLFIENEADTAVIVLPVGRVSIRVRPEYIAKEAGVRDVRRSHYIIDSQDAVQAW